MGKIKFMAEEFFCGFRKNLFKNILLMVMFTTSLLMTILMGSYYLDLGEENDSLASYRAHGTTLASFPLQTLQKWTTEQIRCRAAGISWSIMGVCMIQRNIRF